MNNLKNEFLTKYVNNICYECNKNILVDEKIKDEESGKILQNLSNLQNLSSAILKYNSITINCPYTEYGCKWKDKMDLLEEHKGYCEYEIIFCDECKLTYMKMDSIDGKCPLCI